MLRDRKPLKMILLWTLAIGWVAVLFYFSGQTGEESGELSAKLTRLLMRMLPMLDVAEATLEFYIRKLAHFGIFAVEGLLLGMAMMETARDVGVGFVLTGILCTMVAAANEFHQSLVEGRSCNGVDVWIDSVGALCGIAAAAALFWLAERICLRTE